MIKIIYKTGRTLETDDIGLPEYLLAVACYQDDESKVRRILDEHSDVDVNAYVGYSKSRGNGTPLVLTGSLSIAQILVGHGADVNHPSNWSADPSKSVTPLMSARKELTKAPVKQDAKKIAELNNLIDFLLRKGAVS